MSSKQETHPDVDFAVNDAGGQEQIFKTFDEAAGFAVVVALATEGRSAIDVLIWSEEGALAHGGDHALEVYREDPDASVHNRIYINATSMGRVA